MQRNCRTARETARAQAEATAAAIIAQGCQLSARSAPTEEPMNRYIHPIPAPRPASGCTPVPAVAERILETLCYQNQLLLDLIAAVNALTAATLNARGSHSQP